MSKCAACEALQRALVEMGRVAVAEEEAAVIAERERILALLDHHLDMMKSAPFSGPNEAIHFAGLISRIREGK